MLVALGPRSGTSRCSGSPPPPPRPPRRPRGHPRPRRGCRHRRRPSEGPWLLGVAPPAPPLGAAAWPHGGHTRIGTMERRGSRGSRSRASATSTTSSGRPSTPRGGTPVRAPPGPRSFSPNSGGCWVVVSTPCAACPWTARWRGGCHRSSAATSVSPRFACPPLVPVMVADNSRAPFCRGPKPQSRSFSGLTALPFSRSGSPAAP
mmetsp:Transcript_36771/g.118226  ORF Transcript_36771/g.118226 Transcript_36771/m.118226 type:complete len:205 (+) Transcript_36771:675-1289(+)